MDESLNTLIPNDENQPYDIRDAVTAIFDRDSFLEIQPAFAPNAVVGFVRLDGYSVGVVANQPACMSGAYVAMGSKQMRTDLAVAWPTAQIAVMGAEPAVVEVETETAPTLTHRAVRRRELPVCEPRL